MAGRKRKRTLADLRQQIGEVHDALRESRELRDRAESMPRINGPVPYCSFDLSERAFYDAIDETEYGRSLFVFFDKALCDKDPRLSGLFLHVKHAELAKKGAKVGLPG